MNKKGVVVKDSKILILGITFKENCPDIRNTKVVDIYHTLREYTDNITVYDPWANAEAVLREYHVSIVNNVSSLKEGEYDAVILAVAHKEFLNMDVRKMVHDGGVIYDVKGVLDKAIVDGRL